MRNHISAILLSFLLLAWLISCQPKLDTEEEIKKITFSVNISPILSLDLWSIFTNRYMAEHPDVEIELVAPPSSNIMHRDFVKTLLSTGQFPDVTVMASPRDFVDSGALMPLPVEKLDFLDNPLAGQIGGKTYVALFKVQVGGFWYNRSVFDELGLSEPQTYAELLSISELIAQTDYIPIVMGLKDGWPQLVLASMLLSADILTKDPEWGSKRNRGEVSFSDANIVRALEKYQTLVTQYANQDMASVSYAQMLEYFFTGKALMLPMGSWVQGEEAKINPDFEVGFFPVPSDDQASSISVWANEGLAIGAQTKYPEESLDIIRFFMTDKDWYAQFLETEMLFPATKEPIDYPMSRLRSEVGEEYLKLKKVEHWYDMTGEAALLPGLQAFFNKMTSRIAMGEDVPKELELFDREWELADAQR